MGIANFQRFPTRLIDIQEVRNAAVNSKFHLVNTADHDAVDEYVTLKPSLGRPKQLHATIGKFGRNEAGIASKQAPRDFSTGDENCL